MRGALVGVVEGGTASASAIKGVQLAGKTGTAQSGTLDETGRSSTTRGSSASRRRTTPKIVVAVMIEFGGHGTRAARDRVGDHRERTSRSRRSSTITTDG